MDSSSSNEWRVLIRRRDLILTSFGSKSCRRASITSCEWAKKSNFKSSNDETLSGRANGKRIGGDREGKLHELVK